MKPPEFPKQVKKGSHSVTIYEREFEKPDKDGKQRKYLEYDRQDLAYLKVPPALWSQLTAEDRATLRGHCERAISEYDERLEP